MSVMTGTALTVRRSNSVSICESSPRRRSKTSLPEFSSPVFPVDVSRVAKSASPLTVISELHVDAEVMTAQHGDDLLKCVSVFAAHAHGIALNAGLSFLLAVFDE